MTNEIVEAEVLPIDDARGHYDADNIQVLEGLEAVRKRPSMYIGDVGVRGLHHLIWEVVDNSIDEALAGYCDTIQVTINPDNSITVKDNGRGIPTGINAKMGKSALEVVMTVLHAGGKFDKDTYKVSGGLHGVGVSCVNALSTRLTVEVHREGKVFEQEYHIGVPQYSVREIGKADDTGTTVTFKPDVSIFTETVYKFDTVAGRLRELAFLNKGIRITLTDLRDPDEAGNFITKEFYSEGGLVEFVKYLDENRPSLAGMEPMYMESEKGAIPVQVAMVYNQEGVENISSYVNNISTIEGGTHVQGFRSAISRVLKKYAEEYNLIGKKNGKIEFDSSDFRKGLTAVISVKVAEPQFEGQTKTKLGNQEAVTAVSSVVGEILRTWLEEHPKEAKLIVDKVLLSAQARIASASIYEKMMSGRKDFMSGMGMPGKLADCSDTDPEKCEIYLVEGDSAGGSAKQGRNRAYQAILPLRGKILNVEKAMEHKIYENEEIKNIITALGIRFEKDRETGEMTMNLDKIRYHKVIIMTDADVDGSHIRTLILTLFFRNMRSLIENGYLYIAQPPLYLVKKGKEERYCWTEPQREAAVRDLAGNGREENVGVQRYKGLGEMNPEQLWTTTMDPDKRSLKKVTIESAAEADHVFSTLMGDEVAPRREFIERNAKYARVDV